MIKEMTEISVREMTKDDIPCLKLEHEWLRPVYYDFFEEGRGPAWVFEDQDGPIVCFGAVILWQGVCEIWFSLIREDRNIAMIRMARKFLDEQTIRFKIRRYHCTVSDEVGARFAKFFGFTLETPNGMKNYNPDKSTGWLYSKVI